MKTKHISFIILLLCISLNFSFSQFGWQKIFNADTCGIYAFKHYKVNYDTRKIIYIQFNLPGLAVNSTEALYYSWCKLEKNTSSWIQKPHNSFLYSFPYYCPWPNSLGWRYYRVDDFAISGTDQNLILETRDVPSCGPSGFSEPIQDTRITYNGGTSNTTITTFGNDFIGNSCGGFDIDPVNDAIMYMCYRDGNSQKYVYKSTNRGLNWITTDTVQTIYSYGMLKINPMRRNDIFIRASGNMLKSSDGGLNFNNVGGNGFTDLVFDRTDSSIYGYSQNKIYKSIDNGNNWSIISGIPSASIRCLEINPDNHNILYAGNDSGLYVSTNAGNSWSLYNNSFNPSRRVIGLSKDVNTGDTLYAVTSDAVYKVWGSFIVVGVNNYSTQLPSVFSLYQNYPNPFNPSTEIKYELLNTAFVTIKIYNVLGEEVAVLINNEYKSAGRYNVTFDGSNLASGVYFYSLTADTFQDRKKMVLIK